MPEGFGPIPNMKWMLDRAFSSQVMETPIAPQLLWGVATVPARTAGLSTYIFEIIIFNGGCDDGIIVFGNLAGVQLCPPIRIAKGASISLDKVTPIVVGDQDVYIYANQGMMSVQIKGVQD